MTEFAQIKKVYGNQLQSQMGQGGMQQPGTQPPIGPQPGVGP
jgi:hypothetical protein